MKDETVCSMEHDVPSGNHSHTYTHVLYKDKQTYRLCILINQEKKTMQTKEQQCFEEALVLVLQSNAYACILCMCVYMRTWTVEGSDHNYQAHSQFCSGICSASLCLHLLCLRAHTCSQPLTTRHASVMCRFPLIYSFLSGE